ncbi:MAG TPA: NHLP bacteriocin system secretion protein [Fusobacteria bacterium]|nr:NHLP bacteriocin system secretion protein [Fusobacteriota bacterium]|tara:strand:+ start:8815 stop:10116 length:1302 start_codon:yes stop_codon:yes gene_type:complete
MKNKENKKKEKKNNTESKTIFRKSSLAKLSSPEHLDKLIKVTDSKGWLSLMAALFLVSLTVVWSFVGELPTKVRAMGILVKSDGIRSIQHLTGGVVSDVAVSEGDTVEKGDVIARLSATTLINKISNSRFELGILKNNLDRYMEYRSESREIKRDYFDRSRESFEENLRDLDRDILSQQKKIEAQKMILSKGGISEEELQSSQQALDRLEASKESVLNELSQLTIEELSFNKQIEDTTLSMISQIKEKEEEIEFLQDQLDDQSKIVSPFSGRIVSSNVKKDSIIPAGQTLFEVEIDGKDVRNLEAVLFVPAIEAKKVEMGMDVQISPSTVNSSEYGVLIGRVTKVNEYPSSAEHISQTLGSELARTYSSIRDPIEIRADLIPDSSNNSGYKWSSRVGPPVAIKTGTPSTADVVVKVQKPITLVFPILSRYLGD